jgi:endoglucanase
MKKYLPLYLTILLLFIFNYNLLYFPKFSIFEIETFSVLSDVVSGSASLIIIKLLTLLCFLVSFFILKFWLQKLYNQSYILLVISTWLLIYELYQPFSSLSKNYLLFVTIALLSLPVLQDKIVYIKSKIKKIFSKQKTNQLVIHNSTEIIERLRERVVIISTLMLLFAFVLPTFRFDLVAVIGIFASSITLFLYKTHHTKKLTILAALCVFFSFGYLITYVIPLQLVIATTLLQVPYYIGILKNRIPIKIQPIIATLFIAVLLLVNIQHLSLRWNEQPNKKWVETQSYLKKENSSNIKTIYNHPLLKTLNGVSLTDIEPEEIYNDKYRVVLDTTQKDRKTEQLLKYSSEFLTTFESSNDEIIVFSTNKPQPETLSQSWELYKSKFIKESGQVIDLQQQITTSEGQAYALWRAVVAQDKNTFDRVLDFTIKNFQVRNDDSLLAWKATAEPFQITDYTVATDADVDIAYALIYASNIWSDEVYLNTAKELIEDIWDKLVYNISGRYYLGFSDASFKENQLILNPSYFAPYAYEVFSNHSDKPWKKLIEDTYFTLDQISKINPQITLPPNWIALDTNKSNNTQLFFNEAVGFGGTTGYKYGYDAFRTFYRVALHYQLFRNENARKYLELYQNKFETIYKSIGFIPSVLELNGSKIENFDTVATNTALVSIWSKDDKNSNKASTLALEKFNDNYWNSADNYYDNNWGWFGLALVTQAHKNIR